MRQTNLSGGEVMSDSTVSPVKQKQGERRVEHPNAIPADSVFFNKIVPGLLLALAVLTVIFVIIAAGVFLGLIPWL